jgi:hypothetical protein
VSKHDQGANLSPMRGLAKLRKYRSKKISSWDRSGGNRDFVVIPKGKTHTIADIKGPACITHIWITVACEDLLYECTGMGRRRRAWKVHWEISLA